MHVTYTSGDPEVFQKGGWEGEGWLGEKEDEKNGGGCQFFKYSFLFVICIHSQIKKIKKHVLYSYFFLFLIPSPPPPDFTLLHLNFLKKNF